MPTLDEIQGYILANSTQFKVGGSTGSAVPLWLSRLPADEADTSVGIYDTGGLPPQASFSSTAPLVRQPGVQVLSRSTSYPTARSNAQAIWDLMFGTINADYPTQANSTSTVRYLAASPNQDLIDMGTDQNHRHLVSANYQFQKEPA